MKYAHFVFTAIFLVASIFSSLLIPMSLKERYLGELEAVSGKIERVEMTNTKVSIFLESDEREYWVIPAHVAMITRERIRSDLTAGTIVNMEIAPFRSRISVNSIIVDDTTILDIDEVAEKAYSDAMVTLWFGIILVSILFPLSLAFFAMGIHRIIKRKRMDSSELNEYGERKILCNYLENTIAIYHEPFILTIFLNGELLSQNDSIFAEKRKIPVGIKVHNKETNEYTEETLTLTLNGFGTLRLYHKDKLLAKKRQPFG